MRVVGSLALILLAACGFCQNAAAGPPPERTRRPATGIPDHRERRDGEFEPTPGSIQPDILLVNTTVLTAAEVLYPMRERIAAARVEQTPKAFREWLVGAVRSQVQQDVGSLLVYADAEHTLNDNQKKALDEYIRKRVEERASREFGGSSARLAAHLKEAGITLEQFKERQRREFLVGQYTREKLMPQVKAKLSREDLEAAYRENVPRYTTEGSRELLVIEAPFAKFVPDGVAWNSASSAQQEVARTAAEAQIRAADAELRKRGFADVAREFSRGPAASSGGSWGKIGRPLQAPYDTISAPIFKFQEGQRSAPLETSTGWFIVQCGRVEPTRTRGFTDVQEELRQELLEKRYAALANEYVLGLAGKASVLGFDSFVASAIQRAAENK